MEINEKENPLDDSQTLQESKMSEIISADGLSELALGILIALQSVYLLFDELPLLFYIIFSLVIPLALAFLVHIVRERSIYSILAEFLDNPKKLKLKSLIFIFLYGLSISLLTLGILRGESFNLPASYNNFLTGLIFIILFNIYLFRAITKGDKLFKILAILLIVLTMVIVIYQPPIKIVITLIVATQSIPLLVMGIIYRKKFFQQYYNQI